MELRYITVPQNAPVEVSGEPWSFAKALRYVIDTDPRFNATGAGIRAGIRILAVLGDRDPGYTGTLDEPDWKELQVSFETQPAGLHPPFMTAIGGVQQPANVPGRTFIGYLDALSDEATKSAPAGK